LESIRAILSKNLLELRHERGLSQSDLAEKAGFQMQSYNRWENGKSWPEPSTIEALARALNVPESRLFLDASLISPKVAIKVLNELVASFD
jgi:transcriptional regulator with XRE-family HTH domain